MSIRKPLFRSTNYLPLPFRSFGLTGVNLAEDTQPLTEQDVHQEVLQFAAYVDRWYRFPPIFLQCANLPHVWVAVWIYPHRTEQTLGRTVLCVVQRTSLGTIISNSASYLTKRWEYGNDWTDAYVDLEGVTLVRPGYQILV